MPELPEVEAVCRKLRESVLDARIRAARVLRPRIIHPQTVDEFEQAVTGARIERIDRRAKNILIRLDAGRVIRVHLRMTGNLFVVPDVRFHSESTRAYFELADHRGIVFEDQRALGRISLHTEAEIEALMEPLGPEPLSDQFTAAWFAAAANTSRQPAKLFLMDQNRIAGLGNIYTAEALYRAKVHPARVVSRLSRVRLDRLHGAIVQVLRDAVQSACNAYSGPGRFEEAESFPCSVYDREGERCQECDRAIRRIQQGGRSTYYCPGCQK